MLKLWDPSIIISSLYLYLKQRSLTNVSFCSVEQNVALTILIYLCFLKKNQGKVTVPLMKNLFSVSCDRWLSGLSAFRNVWRKFMQVAIRTLGNLKNSESFYFPRWFGVFLYESKNTVIYQAFFLNTQSLLCVFLNYWFLVKGLWSF